ncbi:MAG: LamG domain-containing protein [Phycisphaerales bacterium]
MSCAKLSGDDGSIVWQDFDARSPGIELTIPAALAADAGSNVFLVGTSVDFDGPEFGQKINKYTQPFTGVPTIQSAAGELAFENQGIWAPGAGNLVAEEHLFDFSWNDIGVDIGGTFSVPIAGDFGGGFEFTTTGTLSAGVKAELNGGTCDVHLPFTVEYTVPDMAKLGPGSPVTIEVEYTPDPAARITSCFTPTFNAGLTAGVSYSVYSDAYLVAFSEFLLDVVFVNVPYTQIMEDYIPGMNLLDILSAVGFPVPGEWFHIDIPPKGLFTADFRTPQMFAQGTFNPETNTFSTESKDRFFKFGVSVTEALLRIIGATATFEFTVPEPPQGGGNGDDEEEGSDFEIHGEGSALQLIGKVELGGKQNIDVGVVPMVRYEFSDGIPTQIIPINQNLTFTLPPKPFDGHVDIVPTVLATADFMNKTDIEVIPGIEWKTIEVAASASAFGFDVLSVGPFCFLCFDWDLSEILEALGVPNPTAVNFGMNVFDGSWQIPFAEIPLPCIRVNASTTNLPHLIAASREAMSMIIYDQTSPSPSSFNVSTDGVSRMLLFGERLNSTSVANIEHWGRFEALPTTWINDNTLLVEVPNRFRLLPGVAKVYVTTNFGVSETIDLSVKYPTPRLDAVNPNLWAADPDLATLPIAVIDAKSFAYNDTFIARRDYYIKMRDDLWSDVTDGGFAGGAAEYFPYFDFNQMPGFPAVLWHNTRSDLRGLTFTNSPPSLVTCGANAAHNVTPGLTVEAMVRWQAGGGFINQVLTTDDPRAAGIRWGILNDGRVDFTTLGVQNYLTTVPRVPVDTWTHVAVVFDTGGEANFYINGEYVETVNGSPIIINNANAAVLLGGDSIGNHFVGDMAEVRLWDVMRTPAQIAANFNNALSGSEPGLIGYWPLNDLQDLGVGAAGANDVKDYSPIGANGDTVNISNTTPVVFSGEFTSDPIPLPRFVQPLDNGIHNVRLAESQYDRPQAVPVVLCNPGPGGGMSNELILTIAAPVPVAQSVEPSSISPVDIPYSENYFDPMDDPVAQPIELRITGPAHVPNFNGYEEPKYGNFNADSVVRFNGIDLHTEFTSSSILTAMLPPEMVTLGDHSITVFTPSNGTQYFEELRVDADGNGVPDAVPVFQGLVDSGGESAPLLFRIRYREPVITSMSPNRAEVNAVAFDDSQYRPGMAPVYNATLLGADFRDGAIVYFDNQPRDTEFVSAGMLRVKLLMSDVAVAGDFPITVRNPHPDGQISEPRNFEVFVPAMPAAQRARNIARENRKTRTPLLNDGVRR